MLREISQTRQASRFRAFTVAAGCIGLMALMVTGQKVHATAFTPDLVASGSIEVDAGFLSATNGATLSGSIATILAGTSTSTNYTGAGVGGTNPLNGVFSELNDGFDLSGRAMAATSGELDAEFSAGIDFILSLFNASAMDTLNVTLRLSFNNSTDADGPDAFGDSELSVSDVSGGGSTELAFTDVISDTLFGDQLSGNPLGTFGALVTDNGTTDLMIELDPGEIFNLSGFWTLNGGAFLAGSSVSTSLIASLRIIEVTGGTAPPNVIPTVPSSLVFLFGLGAFGLLISRHHHLLRIGKK